MGIAQITVLSILGILCIIGFLGTLLNNKEENRVGYITIWFIVTGIIFTLLILTIQNMEKYYKQVKDKCPQYEKIDNVYILKK